MPQITITTTQNKSSNNLKNPIAKKKYSNVWLRCDTSVPVWGNGTWRGTGTCRGTGTRDEIENTVYGVMGD